MGSYDLSNPQSLNRYAYVLNNPTSQMDPSGLYTCNSCGGPGTDICDLIPLFCYGGSEGGGGYTGGGGGGGNPVNPGHPFVFKRNAYLIWLRNFQLQLALLDQGVFPVPSGGGGGGAPNNGFGAEPNGCLAVNGRTVCPSPIDKYNFLHPGQTNYRDSNSRCSQHTTVNNMTGQVQSHIDEFNPNDYFLDHVILDVIPDVIYDITGSYLFPTGNQFCPQ